MSRKDHYRIIFDVIGDIEPADMIYTRLESEGYSYFGGKGWRLAFYRVKTHILEKEVVTKETLLRAVSGR